MNPVDISLYGIIDPEHCLGRELAELAKISVENGVTLIQYRDKKNGIRTMIENASAIRDALKGTNVPLIINDRVDVAIACNADGVHLGQEDMPVDHARSILGEEAIMGLSIKTVEEARSCPVDRIDYAFVGGVFVTHSKDNPSAIGIDGWMERANLIKNTKPEMPVGAIAGIDSDNAKQMVAAGCDGVAVISSIYMAEDVASATRELSNVVKGKSA
ncbi:MAG: thiamine phosphate synthase [Pseudomonadota bacterium]